MVEGGKGYVVVEAVVVRRGGLLTLLLGRRPALLWLPIWSLARMLALGFSAQQLHGAAYVDVHLSGVALNAVLFPLAGMQLALDVDLRSLAKVFPGDLGDLPEQRDAVPLSALSLLARALIRPNVR